jgi:hypothetical protein
MAPALIAALALLLAGASAPLVAQEAKKEEAKAQASSAPSAEQGFKFGLYEAHSDFEVGYRWVTDVAGSNDMYRSMINLGEGPKLLHSNLSLRSKYGSGGLFDRLDLSIDNWGGDPYNTMRLNMSRTDLYEFRADYRKLNYFNFIPTYANPLIGQGSTFDQHGLDVAYRSTDLEFKLFPNSRIRPFVGYTRTSGFGPGFTTDSLTGNEFILNSRWQYSSDEYRGGLEISVPTLTLTLEQGYRLLRNDSTAYDTYINSGNGNSSTFLGQPVTLTSLNRGYHDRTSMPVTKLMAKWTPFSILKFTGRYAYSLADVDGALGEVRTGSLVSLEDRLFYRSALDGFSSTGKQPNHNGSFTVEFSPFSRITLLDQFDTRRNHISGDAILATTYFRASSLSGGSQVFDTKAQDLLHSYLAFNRTQNQAEADIDLGYGFVARGGYRYTFVEASLSDTQNGITDARSAEYTQHTGIVGITYRPGRWLHLGLDYESNSSDRRLLRTDLVDYNQFKCDWRLEPVKSLSVSGWVSVLGNRFSHDDIDQRVHNRDYSLAMSYNPNERFNLSLDYQRSDILSAMDIVLPQTLDLAQSHFDEKGSSVGGSMGIGIYRGLRTDLGYRVILNAGSFPLNFYQPFASLSIPLPSHFAIKTSWQYFGYNERGTSLQDYRTHIITVGLAFSR